MSSPSKGSGKMLTGEVVNSGADKTITVRVERKVKHPLYGKFIRKSKKYRVHDEKNECQQGDLVAISETVPISKTKAWRLAKVVNKSQGK